MQNSQASKSNRVALSVSPPDRYYGEQLGWNLFERARSLLESGLLDLAFVLDSLIRLGEVGPPQIASHVVKTVQDRRFLRFVALWGAVIYFVAR